MALLHPAVGLPADQNVARISAAIDQVSTNTAQLSDLQASVSANTIAVATAGSRITALVNSTNATFAGINNTFTGINARLDAYGNNLAGLNSDVTRVVTQTVPALAASTSASIQAAAKTAADNLSAAVADFLKRLADEVAARNAAIAKAKLHPGAAPFAFTSAVFAQDDDPSAVDGDRAFNLNGDVIRVSGATTLGPRARVTMESGRLYRERFAFTRSADAPDPSNHAVRLAVAWFDQSGALISRSLVSTTAKTFLALRTADGRQEFAFTVGRRCPSADLKAPPGAVSYRPYLQTYGDLATTDVETISHSDVTDAPILPAITQDVVQRLTAQEDIGAGPRLAAIEQDLQSPVSRTYAILAVAKADTIPPTVSTLEIRGGAQPGDGTRLTYRRTSPAQAQASSDYFRSADGAYWARVDGQVKATDLGQDVREFVYSRAPGTFALSDRDGTLATPFLGRMRQLARYFGDLYSVSGGSSDDTSGVISEITAARQDGRCLHMPEGETIRVTDTIPARGLLKIRGTGCDPLTGKGDILFMDHAMKGIAASPEDGFGLASCYLSGFGILRPQNPVVAGQAWGPIDADFDLDMTSMTLIMDDVFPLCSTRFLRLSAGFGNQTKIGRILGTAFKEGVRIDNCYDAVNIETIHFWPFLARYRANEVYKYQVVNFDAVHLRRVDNAKIGSLFAYSPYRTLRFGYFEGVGSSQPSGVSSKVQIGMVDSDIGRHAVYVDDNAQYTVASIADLSSHQEEFGTTADPLIYIGAPDCRLDFFGRAQFNNARGQHILAIGANTYVTLGDYVEGTYNGVSSKANANQNVPALQAVGGSKISVKEWRRGTGLEQRYSGYRGDNFGAPRVVGDVSGVLGQGAAVGQTDSAGRLTVAHNAGQQPSNMRLSVPQNAAFLVLSGLTSTTFTVTAYSVGGVPVPNTTIVFGWQATVGY
jgi:hypothetical protein